MANDGRLAAPLVGRVGTSRAARGRRPARGTGSWLEEEDRVALLRRLVRAEGQVRAVRRMIERGECADDVVVQIAAAKGALMQVAARILERHLTDCATRCMIGSPDEVVRRVSRAVTTILRQS
ncbi:MAG: metal-sensitive transcriptional regulator [Planctomycetales bacterium]|nr:metal-sensitive transcriptional regulator [Planctomycetales bacterium]